MGTDGELTPMTEATVQLHEIYLSMVDAGFSEVQAMDLVYRLIRDGMAGDADE